MAALFLNLISLFEKQPFPWGARVTWLDWCLHTYQNTIRGRDMASSYNLLQIIYGWHIMTAHWAERVVNPDHGFPPSLRVSTFPLSLQKQMCLNLKLQCLITGQSFVDWTSSALMPVMDQHMSGCFIFWTTLSGNSEEMRLRDKKLDYLFLPPKIIIFQAFLS